VQIRVEAERFADCNQKVDVTSADVVYVAIDDAGKPTPVQKSK
jgi:acyl-CoA hydrolase